MAINTNAQAGSAIHLSSDDCPPARCSGNGDCKLLGVGETIEQFECVCDLWHTGQRCEHFVRFPVVVAVTCTLLASLILFFCWYSSHRFSKKKIHIPRSRARFADYLHNQQKMEKEWLKNTVEYMSKNTGKTRDIPFDERLEQEEKSVREVKKVVEEKPQPAVLKEKSANKQVEELKEAEKAKEFLKEQERLARATRSGTITKEEEEDAQNISGNSSGNSSGNLSGTNSGPMPLKVSPSDASVPPDAPKDYKIRKQKHQELEKKALENAEMKSRELNKKKRK